MEQGRQSQKIFEVEIFAGLTCLLSVSALDFLENRGRIRFTVSGCCARYDLCRTLLHIDSGSS